MRMAMLNTISTCGYQPLIAASSTLTPSVLSLFVGGSFNIMINDKVMNKDGTVNVLLRYHDDKS